MIADLLTVAAVYAAVATVALLIVAVIRDSL